MRVGVFPTCLGGAFFPRAVRDTCELLRRLGVEATVAPGATCCGQPALNAGYRDEARRAAHHTARTLDGFDYVVVPSGSCAGMLRHDVSDRSPSRERVFELSQFIVQVMGITDLGSGLTGHRVAYHHGCHALRMLGERDEPLRLLSGAGAEIVEWSAAEECCGFGGLFSVKLPHVSSAMADVKFDALPEVDYVVTADPGCILQLAGRATRRGDGTRFRHLATVLLEASEKGVAMAGTGGQP